ncbi:MAG TPA: DUF2066 domain-containing protein [Stellaceae bacterium]|nr:DUF2066 domain-containing protein [Stellaceae bacterium]
MMPLKARGKRCRRFSGAVLLVALAVGIISLPVGAQDADPFTATVTVDATADTVIKAREAARIDGQRRALAAVVEQLSGGGPPAKAPKLDDKAITDLVASFEVANERMSAVRYVADYTFHFRAAEVRRVLGNAGIALGGEPGKPGIVIPVYQSGGQPRLWDDPNPWRDAWEQRPPGAGRLVVPLGDAGDIAAIDGDRARAEDANALAEIARRNGADETIVALAATRGPGDKPSGVDVTVRRYRAGRLVDSRNAPFDANPGESARDLLRRAAAAVAAQIESGWKTAPVPGYDQAGSLTAILPIAGLDDWVQARERLAAVPTIRKIALVALSRQEATIEIGYAGSIDQLKDSLAGINLDLVRGDPSWRLARTRPGAAR